MTLIESTMALAIISIVFAAVLPQFRNITLSWDSRQANGETLQNGRVLIDHLNRNLQTAQRITAVSDPTETNGYIEFETNDSTTVRYEISADNYVQFGAVGNLYDLAGPVSQLSFSCYALDDLASTTTVVESIRYIKTNAIFTKHSETSQDRTCTAAAYLWANNDVVLPPVTTVTDYDYSSRIQGTNIFAYAGEGNQEVPLNATSPSSSLNSSQYDCLEFNDGTFYIYSVSSNSRYAQIRYVINIDDNKNEVTQITATWNGKGINTDNKKKDGASLYIWNYASSDYELLQTSADSDAEVTLTEILTQFPADYIGGASADAITLLLVSNDKLMNKYTNELLTDYLKLSITASSGGGPLLP